MFQSHFCYGWETVALYSSGILRHLLSWRWGSPFTSYTYISGFYRAGRPGVSRRPARWFLYFTQRKNKNENFLPELAVAFYDGLINKLLCDGARTSVRGTDLWNNFHLLSGFDADIPNGCLRPVLLWRQFRLLLARRWGARRVCKGIATIRRMLALLTNRMLRLLGLPFPRDFPLVTRRL